MLNLYAVILMLTGNRYTKKIGANSNLKSAMRPLE